MTCPIVVATDFKPRSDRALDRAAKLATDTGRELVVVYAIENWRNAPHGDTLKARIASVMPPDAPAYRSLLPEGPAPEMIAQAAEDEEAFCLVLGVARYNSVGDYFLGTAVDEVLRRSPYPVLVVKERPKAGYEHIVIGTDLSKPSARAVEAAVEMFPDAQLHLVHAFHVPYEAWQKDAYVKEELAETAQRHCDSFTEKLEIPAACRERMTMDLIQGSPTSAIKESLEKYDAHLCALTSHGHGGLRQALLGSTVSDLLRTIPVDTLVIHPQHERRGQVTAARS